MAVNLVKVESQADYSGVGKLVDAQYAVMDITESITYATGGVELDLTDINADLVADDVLAVYAQVKTEPLEAGVLAYTCQYDFSTGKLKLIQHSASANAEASAGSITTDFRLVVFFVEPGTNA